MASCWSSAVRALPIPRATSSLTRPSASCSTAGGSGGKTPPNHHKKGAPPAGRGGPGGAHFNRRGGGRGADAPIELLELLAPVNSVEVADLHGATVVAPGVGASNPTAPSGAANVVAVTRSGGRESRAGDDAARNPEAHCRPPPQAPFPLRFRLARRSEHAGGGGESGKRRGRAFC